MNDHWEEREPWVWLAEIANRVLHKKQREYARDHDGLIHAGRHDFAEAFEKPLQLIREEIIFDLQMEYSEAIKNARNGIPNFFAEALETKMRINKLRFDLAIHDNPDTR